MTKAMKERWWGGVRGQQQQWRTGSGTHDRALSVGRDAVKVLREVRVAAPRSARPSTPPRLTD